MATQTHKPFRELVKPNSNFEFVGKRRLWGIVSALLIAASIGMLFVNKSVRGDYMNWSIDFKGGTELILAFTEPDPEQPDRRVSAEVGAGDIRKALGDAGYSGFAVADFSWSVADAETGRERTVRGMKVATREFGAVAPEVQESIVGDMVQTFPDRQIENVTWSGDRMFVRSLQPIDWQAMHDFLRERYSLELKPWGEEATTFTTAEEGTGEYRSQLSIRGLDAQIESALESALEGIDVEIIQIYAVGARAGKKLRNDGITSLFYAVGLIMLYLAFRFDIRYAPGAVVALIHDALLVVGVFAVTWQEVSLTSVAALLTVIGYSVNDTVVIFDRIRENVGILKDKKFARVINVSLNETLSLTLLTSLTLFVVTLMMNIFGTGLVRNFAFAMNVGVIVGVYSSMFVAAPVVIWIHERWFAHKASPLPGRPGKGKAVAASGPVAEPDPADFADDDDGDDRGDEPGIGPARTSRPGARKKRKRR
jgi:preprotein translocase subunit SecF